MRPLDRAPRRGSAIAILLALASLSVSVEGRAEEAASTKPLDPNTVTYLQEKHIAPGAPIYIRIFKEESELEVWKERPGGRYVLIKTYPICNWSGALGPKTSIGDHMAPEGFYGVGAHSLKPDSKYHLALNIGYPNALDKALGRTGDFIMVHGDCKSVGCFAMTDGLIEEIYAFVREALEGGQARVPVHTFPFRMTSANLARHTDSPAYKTWAPLQEAYDDFDKSRLVPRVAMCDKRYVVNPIFPVEGATPDSAAAACPAAPGKLIAPVSPRLAKKLGSKPLIAIGVKLRTRENIARWSINGSQQTWSWWWPTASASAAPEEKSKSASSQATFAGVRPLSE
ncbi:MAG: murein L,D-transpeptidase family protein [Hyphomicrobiaceae bacterium]